MDNKEKLQYTYSAPTEEEREFIKSVRSKYVQEEKQMSKFERLKQLNDKVNRTPTIVGITIGVIGILIFGTGMTTVLEWGRPILGVVISAIGAIPIALSYFIYKRILNKNKAKYGQEILQITEELLRDSE